VSKYFASNMADFISVALNVPAAAGQRTGEELAQHDARHENWANIEPLLKLLK
jgi:hypothetical protein